MATDVILPALGMSQDTGKIIQWLKAEGEQVAKGEPLAEIETDKAMVEIEAPADGVLAHVSVAVGDDVPVGQVIATILAPGEVLPGDVARMDEPSSTEAGQPQGSTPRHATTLAPTRYGASTKTTARLTMASPKARRLATEQGKDLAAIKGSGPAGAVLAADVLAAIVQDGGKLAPPPTRVSRGAVGASARLRPPPSWGLAPTAGMASSNELALNNTWRIMAERTTQSWTSIPHFYLVREVNVSRLITWREQIMKRAAEKVTYTDLLVKIVAAALRMHPRLNASWSEGKITLKQDVHVGLAVAVEEGLVVPVIHQADKLSLGEIAEQRIELVAKAQAGKLRPQDISGGTFTISNLGMYNVDAFNAIINQPQAAILAVGRIAERVVPVNGQPAVQPMMVLTLSCDHRAVDGARGAQFLDTVATLIEEPLGLLG